MKNDVLLYHPADNKWLHFTNPLEIIQTGNINKVVPKLKQVEDIVSKKQHYAAGFISYEAAPAFDESFKTHPPNLFPLIWFGIFEKPKTIKLPTPKYNTTKIDDWYPTIDRGKYNQLFSRVKHYLRQGDTYQVNLTFRQYADYSEDGWPLFLNMGRDAPYAAYIDMADFTICSASPELFFTLRNGQIISRPMKGTAPRGRTNEEDQSCKNQLYNSCKDRAENVMIVDMIRNDIGKISDHGTIKVADMFRIEKYPTVWQMTSTVMGLTNASVTQILTALFPCASITGAPKIKTMEIIAELEDSPRRIYTGAIGYLAPEKEAQFSVAIRTALIDKKKNLIEYGTGGGIVWDSNKETEYQETILKTRVISSSASDRIFSLFETILWTPENGYFLLKYHLNRLLNSAQYFDFNIKKKDLQKELQQLTASFGSQQYKVKILLSKSGKIKCEFESLILTDNSSPIKVKFAKKPVDSSNPFLFHKTTNRSVYDTALAEFPDYEDVLLWNEKGEITETSIANVVIPIDDQLFTPPVSCGLLNGTFRAFLIENNKIAERIIYKKEIEEIREIYLINSVRKWRNGLLET